MINAIAIDDEPLALKVIESLCNNNSLINLQKTFTQPNEAIKYLKKYPIDLLFVDIQMPSISGIKLVESLTQSTMVIFTTAYSEYAALSYELNAIDYLMKPINTSRFNKAILKANEYYKHINKIDTQNEKYIFIRADFSLLKIALSEILYIEGLADYVKIYIHNKKTVTARMTMKDLIEKLPSNEFIRTHRSFIIPIERIDTIRGKTIVISERDIPIGNTYFQEISKAFKQKKIKS